MIFSLGMFWSQRARSTSVMERPMRGFILDALLYGKGSERAESLGEGVLLF